MEIALRSGELFSREILAIRSSCAMLQPKLNESD
jgi:hypothetical protein